MNTDDMQTFLRLQIAEARARLSTITIPNVRAAMEQRIAYLENRLSGNAAPPTSAAPADAVAAVLGRAGDRYLSYRGDIKAAVGVGGVLAFVTAHPEGQPTALYRLDADSLKLAETPLPCGGVALAAAGDTLYVGGTDRRVYAADQPLAGPFASPIAAVVSVAGDRLAILNGPRIDIISRVNGEAVQTLELPEVGTALAADHTGQWLVAGTGKGTVAVFDGQDKPTFEPAEAERLHDGAVTALLFEPEELRFYSAGADHKLFTTHARGRLEPEDKGRDNAHTDPITAIIWAPAGDRLLTGGRDAVLKTWPRSGNVKPAKYDDGVGKVVALAVVTAYNRPRLAVLSDDNAIRFVGLEPDGRFGEPAAKVYGAVDRAKNELGQADPRRRERVLKELAGWNDAICLDLIAAQLDKDSDHQLRLLAAQLLAASENPRAIPLLEKAVGHKDDKVRVEAFRGLRKQLGPADLRPIDLALKAGPADVGALAVKALEPAAEKDDQALARLTGALDHAAWDVRKAALASLAAVFAADPPRAGLVALGSKFGDVRAAALARFYERKLLDDPRVGSAVRRRLEDDDASVRRTAFLVSVLARTGLANFLRKADPDLHRQLNDLQGSDRPASDVPAAGKALLTPDDYDMPLQATASRALDTCLRGARALAVLGDPRAIGLLVQLSREENAPARVEVCRALAALNDPRATTRLRSMLTDADASVRDAAYSALAKIEAADPPGLAAAGLAAAAEDVRRRGLQTLLGHLRDNPLGDPPAGPPDPAAAPAWFLLVAALNDAAPAVRTEAWKSVLNLRLGGGGERTLRFALRSNHADVRREVLTEVTAQPGEPWATPLLYEFFDDPDSGLRAEAFAQATRKTKELAPLEAALASKYPDARRLAIDALIKKRTPPAQARLAAALHDTDRDLRRLALSALVDEDALPALREAAANEHPDVRVRAASALARHGDPAALAPLLDLATTKEPTEKEREAGWLDVAEAALLGLAELGDPAAVAPVRWLLGSKHPRLRKAAAEALAWSARGGDADALRQALPHADPEVRHRAALGLALAGDRAALGPVSADDFGSALGPGAVLAAAVALGGTGDRVTAGFLDHADAALRDRALLVQLLTELRDADGDARRCLECLSAKSPRVRLSGAEAIELYADPSAFRSHVVAAVNDRGDETPWKIAPDVVDSLAAVLAGGPPWLKARVVQLTHSFAEKEQAGWNQAWAVFSKRFAAELAAAKEAAPERTVSRLPAGQLKELAFGAYVGLTREQGGSAATPATVKVRRTALDRLFAVASADPVYGRAALPVLTQSLGDPNQAVRLLAFDHLLALGADRTRLGAESLEAGHTDLGVKGLELLSGSAAGGDAVLERAMLARTDDLAAEAAKLLDGRRGRVPVAAAAIGAAHEPLRKQAVQWLAAEYDQSSDARRHLREALSSRHRKVRESAAAELATKKDPAAFDALVVLMREAAFPKKQKQAIDALVRLGDPRAAAAFLDRIETDPAGTAQVEELLTAAGSFRLPETVDRLLALARDRKPARAAAIRAVAVVSGFDQDFGDKEADDWPTPELLARLHPVREDVLAKLLGTCTSLGEEELLVGFLSFAAYAQTPVVDAALANLFSHPAAAVRNAAVEAQALRVNHRWSAPDPLLKPLKHKDPVTQFHAAEGLALGGRSEGLGVLLSAIEYLDDVALRARAVVALGVLGDARAVDVLLRLAGEDGHALQEPAAEAVGHLRRSPEAEKIGRLLERLSKGIGGVARRALVGLRYLDTDEGWQLLRRRATDKETWTIRRAAVEQLGHKDEPANRDLLLKILSTDRDTDVLAAAFAAARRLLGRESLEPHYALLRHPGSGAWADDAARFGEDVVRAVCDRGDPLRLLELFPACPPDIQEPLEASLLGRPAVPVKEATAGLAHADPGTVRLAARLLARTGAGDKGTRAAVVQALDRWAANWNDRRAEVARDPGRRDALDRTTATLGALAWAAGRVGAPADKVAALAVARPDDPLYRPVRWDAVRCLAAGPPSDAALAALETVARGTDPEARTVAADTLVTRAPARAAKLLEPLASDRPSFTRLLAGLEGEQAAAFVASAAGQVHYQPVALPAVVAAKDVATLAAVAKDRKKPEAARLGAVEGLGVMAAADAEAVLAEVGAAAGDDEDVRKAAWRALRRSKRARGRITNARPMPR